MKKRLYLLLLPALASCGLQIPETKKEAWLAFNQDHKNLSYNTDRIPEKRFFDVDFQETANVHMDTDPATLNNQTISLMDLDSQTAVPIQISLEERSDPLLGVTGRYAKIKSTLPLKYNHNYRLIARKEIKTRAGNAMQNEEIYDFQTEKEPLQIALVSEGFDVQGKRYQVTLKNTSAFASTGLIFEKSCTANTYRVFHAHLKALGAGETITMQMKLIDGSVADNSTPDQCTPLKAYDFLAEREVQVNP